MCGGPIGDHDKPYTFGETEPEVAHALMLRVSRREFHKLDMLRIHVLDVRNGYAFGPARGDLAAEPVQPRSDDGTPEAS